MKIRRLACSNECRRISRLHLWTCLYIGLGLFSGIRPAVSSEYESAASQAGDAFGLRVGLEQFGLYNERQVRGFDLTNTGAYRVDGAYFVREAALPDAVLDGVSVRVGINAARLSYPSPSGVVDYRLKTASPGDHTLDVSLGFRDFFSPFMELSMSEAAATGKYGLAGGLLLIPHATYGDLTSGHDYTVGLVPMWRPTNSIWVRGFWGIEDATYTDYGFDSTANTLRTIPSPQDYSVPWTHGHRNFVSSGLLTDATFGSNWTIASSLFYSDSSIRNADFTFLSIQPYGIAHATFLHTPFIRSKSLSGELNVAHRFAAMGVTHSIGAAIRARRSRAANAVTSAFDLDLVNLAHPTYPAAPSFTDSSDETRFSTDQVSESLTYTAAYGERMEFRSGLHRTRYTKGVESPDGTSSQTTLAWLYNASIVLAATHTTALFASLVRGIEDSGVAPQIAANRNEILPAVLARQTELGLRHTLTPDLALIVSAFEESKPVPGVRGDGVYALLGTARYEGFEVSLTGNLPQRTTIIFGGSIMRPRVTGTDGTNGSFRPAGVPSNAVVTNVEHEVSSVHGLSVDGQLTWQSSKAVLPNSLETPAYGVVNLGGRYRFHWGAHPAMFRIVASNICNQRVWDITAAGSLYLNAPRTLRASMTVGLSN